jgi:hypothetical protein
MSSIMKRTSKNQLRRALQSWHKLNNAILGFREEDVAWLLEDEKARERPRLRFLNRIHGRLEVLRRERERKELGL